MLKLKAFLYFILDWPSLTKIFAVNDKNTKNIKNKRTSFFFPYYFKIVAGECQYRKKEQTFI